MTCYGVQDRSWCTGTNVIFNTGRLMISEFGGEEVDDQNATNRRQWEQQMPHWDREGHSITITNCPFKENTFTQGGYLLLTDLFTNVNHNSNLINYSQCEVWESRPTFLVQRYDFHNLYHQTQGFLQLFQTIHVLNISSTSEILILWVDGHHRGDFDSWNRLYFAEVRPIRFYKKKVVCFKQLVFVPVEFNSILYHRPHEYACDNHPGFQHFVRSVLYGFNLPYSEPSKWPRLTFIVRRNYNRNPYKPPIRRRFENEQQLIDTLTRELGARVEIRVIALEMYPFEQQVEIMTKTDLLVGGHGAGMTHLMYLHPQRSGVLEIHPSDIHGPEYATLANWMKVNYRNLRTSNSDTANGYYVDPHRFLEDIKNFIRDLHSANPQWNS